jgi:hypothetical protein
MNQTKLVFCYNCNDHKNADLITILLMNIPDLNERLDPGDIVPYGECPDCGALVYIAWDRVNKTMG